MKSFKEYHTLMEERYNYKNAINTINKKLEEKYKTRNGNETSLFPKDMIKTIKDLLNHKPQNGTTPSKDKDTLNQILNILNVYSDAKGKRDAKERKNQARQDLTALEATYTDTPAGSAPAGSAPAGSAPAGGGNQPVFEGDKEEEIAKVFIDKKSSLINTALDYYSKWNDSIKNVFTSKDNFIELLSLMPEGGKYKKEILKYIKPGQEKKAKSYAVGLIMAVSLKRTMDSIGFNKSPSKLKRFEGALAAKDKEASKNFNSFITHYKNGILNNIRNISSIDKLGETLDYTKITRYVIRCLNIRPKETEEKLKSGLDSFNKWANGQMNDSVEEVKNAENSQQVIDAIALNLNINPDDLKKHLESQEQFKNGIPDKPKQSGGSEEAPPNGDTKRGETPVNNNSGDTKRGETPVNNNSGDTKKDETTPAKEKIPFTNEAYVAEIDKIKEQALAVLKQAYGKKEAVQESINKALKSVMTEAFRSTHNLRGEERKWYTDAKEKIATVSPQMVEKLAAKYEAQINNAFSQLKGIISTNKKYKLEAQIKNAPILFRRDIAKMNLKNISKTSQNEIGKIPAATLDMLTHPARDVAKTIAKSAFGRNVADKAKTLGRKMGDAKETISQRIKDGNAAEAARREQDEIQQKKVDDLKNRFELFKQYTNSQINRALSSGRDIQGGSLTNKEKQELKRIRDERKNKTQNIPSPAGGNPPDMNGAQDADPEVTKQMDQRANPPIEPPANQADNPPDVEPPANQADNPPDVEPPADNEKTTPADEQQSEEDIKKQIDRLERNKRKINQKAGLSEKEKKEKINDIDKKINKLRGKTQQRAEQFIDKTNRPNPVLQVARQVKGSWDNVVNAFVNKFKRKPDPNEVEDYEKRVGSAQQNNAKTASVSTASVGDAVIPTNLSRRQKVINRALKKKLYY